VEEPNDDFLLAIFPNPAEETAKLAVSYELGESEIQIADINGAILERRKAYINFDFEKIISINKYPSGTYFVRIISEEKTLTQKMIIRR
jgi:hypothetical protein